MEITTKSPNDVKVVIIGAGSIGCWVGGTLLRAGRNVAFLGRPKIAREIAQHGLRITDHEGRDTSLPAERVPVSIDETVLNDADIVIISVKSSATIDAAQSVARHAPKHATVLSFQNGVRNVQRIREVLGKDADVRAVMVPFNVVWAAEGHFHRGVEGDLILQEGVSDLSDILSVEGLVAKTSGDIEAVLWGKILLNLNNALNALSDIPLKAQLSDRGWRKVLAACQAEALAAMKSADIFPHTELPVPLKWMPTILRLPNFLFERVAAKMLAIDENARSSMWEDLKLGRKTEIADLQGEIVNLAMKQNTPSPMNQQVMNTIRLAEITKSGSPALNSTYFSKN